MAPQGNRSIPSGRSHLWNVWGIETIPSVRMTTSGAAPDN
jgi:hypothetical protein